MDGEDDMIVIIVGDDINEENLAVARPSVAPAQMPGIPIKEELVDDHNGSELDPVSILETAKLHGEYINLLKEEYHDCEFLDDNFKEEPVTPVPQEKIKPKKRVVTSESDSDDDEDEELYTKPRISYIDQLRKNFPRMRKDEEYLVAHLTEVMKNIKPPIPPIGFCTNVDNDLVCAYCDKVSQTLPIACRHYQKKHGDRYLSCYACGLTYRCTTGLYKHEKRCGAASARLVLRARGRYLGRRGRTRPYLTLNKFDPWDSTNQPKKRYYCSQCSASFGHSNALKAHEYMHLGVRPFQCDQCPIAYTSATALKRHIVGIHSDVQYICDVCGRSFKAKTTLVIHMNTHLPQRRFPCERCERRFAQKSALQHHVNRDHLNIPPPLACTACPKRFPRVSNLKAHMKAKHGLTLMTRKMFYKALPSMKETQLKKATIVFNQLENDVVTAPVGESIFNKKGDPIRPDDEDEPVLKDEDPEPREHKAETLFTNIEIEPDSILGTEMVQECTIQYEEIQHTPSDTVTSGYEENAIATPKNAVVKMTLPESGELEFVKFNSNKESSDTKVKKRTYKKFPKIDLSMARMKPNRGRSMPLLNDGKNTEIVTEYASKINEDKTNTRNVISENANISVVGKSKVTNKTVSTIKKDCKKNLTKTQINKLKDSKLTTVINTAKTIVIMNECASDIDVNPKKILQGPKQKNNVHKKIPMQTRSGVMKTRSGVIINSEP